LPVARDKQRKSVAPCRSSAPSTFFCLLEPGRRCRRRARRFGIGPVATSQSSIGSTPPPGQPPAATGPEALCWAHGRRKFFELADLAANARRGKDAKPISPLALEAVRRIDAIFDLASTRPPACLSAITGGTRNKLSSR
jgi:hypothetical protein